MGLKLNKFKFYLSLVLFILGIRTVSAQEEDAHLFVHVVSSETSDKDQTYTLEFEVSPGHRLYKESLKFIEGTSTKIQLGLPEGKLLHDRFTNTDKEIFEGLFSATLVIPKEMEFDALKLRYQVCTEKICYLPQEIQVPVVPASRGILFYIETFVSGLAVALTPCIYPLIPITVAIFSQKTGLFPWLNAGLYGLGISLIYGLLGALSSLGGRLFGHWLQSSWVLVSLGSLFVYLSVSYLVPAEGIQLRLIPKKLDNYLEKRTHWGPYSVFLFGLISGLVASPCVTPALVSLLVIVGQRTQPAQGFLGLFLFGMGVSFPVMIVALLSQMGTKILPRSGLWLDWTKRVLSLILLGVTAYLLRPLAKPILGVALGGATLLWLLAFIQSFPSIHLRFPVNLRPFFFIYFLIFASSAFFFRTSATPSLSSYSQVCHSTDSCAQLSQAKWWSMKSDFSEELPFVFRSGFWLVDLRADWCLACLELEEKIFSHKDFIEEATSFGVVLVSWDLTNLTSRDDQFLDQFHVRGLPTVLLLKTDETGQIQELHRWTGLVDKENFKRVLKGKVQN